MFDFKTPSFTKFDQEPEEGIQRKAKVKEAESEEVSEALCLGTKTKIKASGKSYVFHSNLWLQNGM